MTPVVDFRESPVARVVRGLRHPVRALATGLVVLGVVWGIAVTPALVAAVVGAMLGVLAGEVCGRSRARTRFLVACGAALALLGWALSAALTSSESVVRGIGDGSALTSAAVVRFLFASFLVVGFSRFAAVRRPAWIVIEVLLIVVALAAMFAAHRNGMIARPLWLSDWAWQREIDPAKVFLGIGAGAAAALALLLVFERPGALSLALLAAIPLLLGGVLLLVDYTGVPTPKPEDGIGLVEDSSVFNGDPAIPNKTGGPNGAGTGKDEQKDGTQKGGKEEQGSGQQKQEGEGDGGGKPAEAQDGGGSAANAQDGGEGEQPKPPPPPPPANLDDPKDPSPSSSPVPMAVVVFENDYSPPAKAYYFRQGAWSQWNGSRLVPATTPGADADVLTTYPAAAVEVEQPPKGARTKVDVRVAMLVDHEAPFALETPVKFEPVTNPNPDRFTRVYRAHSFAQTIDYAKLVDKAAGNPAWSEAVKQSYLVQHPDERYKRLAEEITSVLPEKMRNSPFAKAAAIKVWLDKELTYSTRERHRGVADPTTHFLFGNRVGYCVHFAHAAVLLWRSVGIPARVGTGYMVPEENRHGGSSLLLRSGDAHAWPELYLEGVGWVVLDISPEHNLDKGGMAVDDDLQRMLGEMAREPDPTETDKLADDEKHGKGALWYAGWIALAGLALALLGLYSVKGWRRVAPVFARGPEVGRVGYRAVLDALADAGFYRKFGEPREAFAKRSAAVAPSLGPLTALHVRARLGARPLGPEEVKTFKELCRHTRVEIRRQVPWWRRILGLLHPVSFIQVK